MSTQTNYRIPTDNDTKAKLIGQAFNDGDFVKFSDTPATGYVPAEAGDTFLTDAATETVLAGVKTTVNTRKVNVGDRFIMATTNDTSALHNDQLMDLTDSRTVNNTGTTAPAGVVRQLGVIGLPADKKASFEVVAAK